MSIKNIDMIPVTESANMTATHSIGRHMMKFVCKFATVVAIAILVAMAPNNALLAQSGPPNPPPDCQGTPFLGPKEATIEVDGCKFTYVYWWRLACGVYYDTYIETVIPDKTNGDDCKDVFDEQYKKIYDACMADVVGMQNPWGVEEFPKCDEGSSPTQWRFFRPSCRTADPVPKHWENGNIVLGGYMPCQKDASKLGYCYKTYTYCWGEDPKTGQTILKSTEISSGLFSAGDCPLGIIINDKYYRCIPNCDEK